MLGRAGLGSSAQENERNSLNQWQLFSFPGLSINMIKATEKPQLICDNNNQLGQPITLPQAELISLS